MRIIYIDVLVITNFIVSLFLLFVVKKISHSASSNLRMIFSGFVLSSASFLILFDNNSFTDELLLLLVKLIISAFGLSICFKTKSPKRILKYLLFYIVINTFFTGICTILWNLTKGNVIYVNNGAVYFDVSIFELVLFTITAYIILSVSEFIKNRYNDKNTAYKAEFEISGKKFKLNAISDTGNRLIDVFYLKPVCVCYSDKIWNELSLENEDNILKYKLHPLTLSTVNGTTVIYTTRPSEIVVSYENKMKKADVCIGFLPSKDKAERCLFDPKILL